MDQSVLWTVSVRLLERIYRRVEAEKRAEEEAKAAQEAKRRGS